MKINKIGQISNDGSQAGTMINPNGLCFTICACTHGYAIGNILVEKRNLPLPNGRKKSFEANR